MHLHAEQISTLSNSLTNWYGNWQSSNHVINISIQQKWSLLISKSVSCGRASVPLLSAILLWMSKWNFPNKKYKCSRVHCSILYNRFLELKKKLEGKFSKPLAKNFKIWLSSLKETFLDATNTSDMHSDDLNFVSSKRGWFFRNGKMDSFQKGKIFTFWK